MKYKDHKRKWENCTQCELSDQRTCMVFARGKVPCDVLFVGEAPGASEDVIGKPFVGPAGKLLDHIIEVGFDGRLDYCITNLVCCFPADAKATKNHEPPKPCIQACSPRLREMYQLCKPQAVVCVGKLSSTHSPVLLRKLHRGKFCDLMHPAAILRMDISQKGLAIQRSIVALEELAEDLLA